MDKEFVISIITPVYNAEQYLEETIDCVLKQSFDFHNVQLILINDGSTDGSGSICRRYQKMYPENIVYIEKENGGVSSARNLGLEYISGKYTFFLDSDDIWERHSFKNIVSFFDKHNTEIDVCTCKMEYIGAFATRVHPLDFKFSKGNRVIDVRENPDYICTTIGNTVFRSSVLKGKVFDENLHYCEDALFLNKCIAENLRIGVVSDAIFYYRKDTAGGNASINVTRTNDWYFGVPKNYYLNLLSYTEEKFGKIPRFFQETIFYDIKWRGNNPYVLDTFTEQQKQEHLDLIRDCLLKIDDEVIVEAPDVPIHKRLYFLKLKHGKDIMGETEIVGHKIMYHDTVLLSLRYGSLLEVRTISVENDQLVIEGVSSLDCIGHAYSLYLVDESNKNRVPVELIPFPQYNPKGLIGEEYLHVNRFKATIPVKLRSKVCFTIESDGNSVPLRPKCNPKTGLIKSYRISYIVQGKYIIKLIKGRFCFYENKKRTRIASELKLDRELLARFGKEKGREIIQNRWRLARLSKRSLKKHVAFISVRADDTLLGNMEKVYDQLDLPKSSLAKYQLGDDPESVKVARKLVATSKIVVTDDYLFLMKEKKPGQSFVQLWHATGAGKYFGQDGTNIFPAEDALYHKNYDLVTVSSEKVRDVYVSALGIPKEKIQATGVARTDDFFDEKYIENAKNRVMSAHPELEGKSVILYTPTFRDIPGLGRKVFKPQLDFDKLSEALLPNQIFVVRPHPVMMATIVEEEYDNIVEIRDTSSNDLMFVSEMMISDYSSTMFEYSLLQKPMAFFCYDYDDYDRDFYIDFDHELPGPILRTQEELFAYLQEKEHPIMDNYTEFYQKYMGACDGHSTERIVKLIENMFYGKE